jgi:hypothetical protein
LWGDTGDTDKEKKRYGERSREAFLLLLFCSFAYILNCSKQNKTKGKQQRTFPNSMTSLFK